MAQNPKEIKMTEKNRKKMEKLIAQEQLEKKVPLFDDFLTHTATPINRNHLTKKAHLQ